MLCGCGKIPSDNAKYTIVTTFFPEYDWVMQILGEKAEDTEVIMLLDKGTDIHSYQPTAEDIVTISTCDMFIYVGGESDKWVKDALKNAVNRGMTVISLIEALGESVKEEETAEGL
ncbi:MAG: zinc ABC transporter substrate-binding protein, partial [Clostridia bacterium]|nr:zinc ABC transporter substrate-binding protein [Clostridia bacterium]